MKKILFILFITTSIFACKSKSTTEVIAPIATGENMVTLTTAQMKRNNNRHFRRKRNFIRTKSKWKNRCTPTKYGFH
jgi:hypothetical protein